MLQTPMLNTVIVPVIRPDLLPRMLETLYKYTEPNFYVYVIDQTLHGLDANALRLQYKNLMTIRTPITDYHRTGNLGFAQATNLGISLVQTPYFMMCNDDVEFLNKDWWKGVVDTFALVERATPERPAVIVNPSSLKLADWSVGLPHGQDHYIMPYKERYSDADYQWLVNEPHYVNEHLTIMPGSVIDGVTMYASVCDTKRFLEVGMLEERFFPGSGEDYSFSCRASMVGYRCVGTTLAYVYHHWSASFAAIHEEDDVKSLMIPELAWNQTNELWGDGFDIWGVKCPQCSANMRCGADKTIASCPKHPEEIYHMPEVSIQQL